MHLVDKALFNLPRRKAISNGRGVCTITGKETFCQSAFDITDHSSVDSVLLLQQPRFDYSLLILILLSPFLFYLYLL